MSVDGTWNLSIATPMGTQSAVLELVDVDGTIKGTARDGADSLALDDLSVDGQRVVWTQEVTRPMSLTVNFDLTVDGDTISGTAKAGMFPASKVTGQRA